MSAEAAGGLVHVASGKIRDIYRVPGAGDLLLIVSSDRISAYDYVLPTLIPDKGRVLTALSVWWFGMLGDIVPHHFVSADDPRIPAEWRGRAMLCRQLNMVAVECVARGYLTGSGLTEYRSAGTVCGVLLPPGLTDGDRLPEPIFTPTTKAPVGQHDAALSYDAMKSLIGDAAAADLRTLTLDVYRRGADLAEQRGILLADTKLEFGYDSSGELTVGDEVLTPDSSRFWPADRWRPGGPQPSFDKQYVRDWLTSTESGWDRTSGSPPPPLPDDVVDRTRRKYVEAYERLTGRSFAEWLGRTGGG